MPLDRAATLRQAEKLLRQGKLDAAITEYLRVVDDQPRDWNTANILGDLYVRTGQIDKAVDQFARIAGSLSEEGFVSKAGALYKKILKLKPDHEDSLLQAGEIAAGQGLLADARAFFNAVAERRRGRGDADGAGRMAIRLGALDRADVPARLAAARAHAALGDMRRAVADYNAVADDLLEKDRRGEAVEVLRRAAALDADDRDLRRRLRDLYVATGDFEGARACAPTVDELKALGAALQSQGHEAAALAVLRDAAATDPGDAALRGEPARALAGAGGVGGAAEHLTADAAGADPQQTLAAAELELRRGNIDEGVALARRLLDANPARCEEVAMLGWRLADLSSDAAFRMVELAADVAVAHADWASGAAALQEFVTRVPNHVRALMRLVEICVDGGLEATMYSAQAQLADAYIEAGSAAEARFIAEDLVAREPWDRSNIERFRRALVLLGEPDPDGLIAERLSGQTPFTSTDILYRGEFPHLGDRSPAAPGGARPAPPPNAPTPANDAAGKANATPTAHAEQESVEVDLSIVLDDLLADEAAGAEAPDGAADAVRTATPVGSGDIEGVFAHLREEASRRWGTDVADEQLQIGLDLRRAGKLDESIAALQAAWQSPRHRFEAAALIGRIYRERGLGAEAIEWFDRATLAPPPTAEDGRALLFELADALEHAGNVARALAICQALQADAGNSFRDIAARVDRLAKVRTGG